MNGRLPSRSESRESLVRARVLRRLERPMSLADQTGMPTLYSLLNSRAYSAEFDTPGPDPEKKNFSSMNDVKPGVSTSRSSGEIETLLDGPPRRANSLADFLFRRKQMRYQKATVINVIENPMHGTLGDIGTSDETAN